MTVNQMIDTREKLEDDVQDFYWRVLEWLDRQAAITERHWMEIVGASANANVELKRQIDEMQAKMNKLGKALNEVAEKWAIAQVEAEDCSKRCMLLEELVQDMWREMLTCPDYASSPCMTNSICERVRSLEMQ